MCPRTVHAFLSANLLLAGTAAAAAGPDGQVALSITGASGASFSGSCTCEVGAKTETLRLDGRVPFATEIRADRVQCRFTADRQITVEARKSGNVTRTTTSGGTVNLRLD